MDTKTSEPKLFVAKGVTKSFYSNKVLDSVDFELDYGEVLGLVGQNGAGKSTLVKILTGVYQMDEGEILLKGKSANLSSITAANSSGISIVFQELSLAPNMSVADNIFIGNYPVKNLNMVNKSELYQETKNLLDSFDVDINPATKVGDLSAGKKQIIEIIKAIAKNPQILILDEPTSSLEQSEIKTLFTFIRKLKQKSYSIIYISHHMSEVFDIVDNIMVLRDGKKIHYCSKNDISMDELIKLIVGKNYIAYDGKTANRNHIVQNSVMTVENLSDNKHFFDINFKLLKGEILGLAGIIGSGKTELCESLIGARKVRQGKIILENNPIINSNPSASKRLGILCIPENRKTHGLFLNDSVKNNIISNILNKLTVSGFLSEKKIRIIINKYQESLKIKMNSPKQIIRFLSGGNQQKILVAKCIADDPKILIAMDPTRGIDVGSKADIHRIIHELSEKGLSVLLISSELDELLNMSDRVLVMNSGRISKQFYRSEFDEQEIMMVMHQSIEMEVSAS